jgi:hypothetical protein
MKSCIQCVLSQIQLNARKQSNIFFPNIALRQSAKENTDLSIKKADWEHIASFCAVLQPW